MREGRVDHRGPGTRTGARVVRKGERGFPPHREEEEEEEEEELT